MMVTGSSPEMRFRHHKLAIALVAGTIVGVGTAAFVTARLESVRAPEIPGFLWPQPKVLPDFTLTDQHGEPFGVDRLKGRWSFLFFGYTNCPDVCPTTLSMLATIDRELTAEGAPSSPVQVVFVSVDPERDTPERLGQYVTYFDPDFLGVTGAISNLEALTRQIGIFVSRDAPDERGHYLVSHGSAVLLIDPAGRFVGVYQAPHDPDRIVDSFRRIRGFLDSRTMSDTDVYPAFGALPGGSTSLASSVPTVTVAARLS